MEEHDQTMVPLLRHVQAPGRAFEDTDFRRGRARERIVAGDEDAANEQGTDQVTHDASVAVLPGLTPAA
jgi:hypothetical protein